MLKIGNIKKWYYENNCSKLEKKSPMCYQYSYVWSIVKKLAIDVKICEKIHQTFETRLKTYRTRTTTTKRTHIHRNQKNKRNLKCADKNVFFSRSIWCWIFKVHMHISICAQFTIFIGVLLFCFFIIDSCYLSRREKTSVRSTNTKERKKEKNKYSTEHKKKHTEKNWCMCELVGLHLSKLFNTLYTHLKCTNSKVVD